METYLNIVGGDEEISESSMIDFALLSETFLDEDPEYMKQ